MKLRRVQCTEAEIIADAPSVQRQAFCIIAFDPVRNRSSRSVRNGKIRFNERTDLRQESCGQRPSGISSAVCTIRKEYSAEAARTAQKHGRNPKFHKNKRIRTTCINYIHHKI